MNNLVEQEIISCLLQKSDKLITIAVANIKPDDFTNTTYRHIYETMYQLFLEGTPIDIVSLIKLLGKEYGKTLLDVQFVALTTGNFNRHLQTLKELSRKAQAKTLTTELATMLGTETIEACQEKAANLLQTLGTRQSIAQANATEGIDAFIDRMNVKTEYFDTGFELINKYVFISKGDFVIVGGRPSSGKTALTLQIGMHIAFKKKVVYFSCETSKEKIYDRLISNYFSISMDDIMRKNIPEEMQEYLRDGKSYFQGMNMVVIEASGWTVAEIKAKATEEQADIIFIDYLTMLKANGKTTIEVATNISRELHIMAQQSKIAVVALSQLNRAGVGEPANVNLRESGQIEQDADLILMIWELQENGEAVNGVTHKLKISKNKVGEQRRCSLNFDGKHQIFKEVVTRYGEEVPTIQRKFTKTQSYSD